MRLEIFGKTTVCLVQKRLENIIKFFFNREINIYNEIEYKEPEVKQLQPVKRLSSEDPI